MTPDAITINGFAGVDGIRPFADIANEEGKGVFVSTTVGELNIVGEGRGGLEICSVEVAVMILPGEVGVDMLHADSVTARKLRIASLLFIISIQ